MVLCYYWGMGMTGGGGPASPWRSCFIPYEDGSGFAGLGLLHLDEIRKLPT